MVHQSKWICLRRFCQILGLIANPDLIRPVAICFKDCIYQSNIFGNNIMIPFMYFYAVFIYEGNFRLPLNVSIICEYFKNIYIFVLEISLKCFLLKIYSAHSRYEKDSERVKTVNSPWPPWRIPSVTPNLYKDPRRLLHSRKSSSLSSVK